MEFVKQNKMLIALIMAVALGAVGVFTDFDVAGFLASVKALMASLSDLVGSVATPDPAPAQ